MNRRGWTRFQRAIEHYESFGFSYFDVPWAVDPEITAITKPRECKDYPFNEKCLVGSAEQGFLQILKDTEDLDKGLYYSITPCFRDDEEDALHHKYFMKLELFSRDNTKFNLILNAAYDFFLKEVHRDGRDINKLSMDSVGVGKDIFYNGIELGSYYKHREYICGTGLAEPRFSEALIYAET